MSIWWIGIYLCSCHIVFIFGAFIHAFIWVHIHSTFDESYGSFSIAYKQVPKILRYDFLSFGFSPIDYGQDMKAVYGPHESTMDHNQPKASGMVSWCTGKHIICIAWYQLVCFMWLLICWTDLTYNSRLLGDSWVQLISFYVVILFPIS